MPVYQNKIAYGNHGFPWSHDFSRKDICYDFGICPIAEELHDKSYFAYEMCMHDLSDKNIEEMINAFYKVWANLDKL